MRFSWCLKDITCVVTLCVLCSVVHQWKMISSIQRCFTIITWCSDRCFSRNYVHSSCISISHITIRSIVQTAAWPLGSMLGGRLSCRLYPIIDLQVICIWLVSKLIHLYLNFLFCLAAQVCVDRQVLFCGIVAFIWTSVVKDRKDKDTEGDTWKAQAEFEPKTWTLRFILD